MLLQEVQTMSIGPRLVTNTNINNDKIFDNILEDFKYYIIIYA